MTFIIYISRVLILPVIFLIPGWPLCAQTAPASFSSTAKPHIALIGFPLTDSVAIEDLVNAPGIRSVDESISITRFGIVVTGKCIGGTTYISKSSSDRFNKTDREIFRSLDRGVTVYIESIVGRNEVGNTVHLKVFAMKLYEREPTGNTRN